MFEKLFKMFGYERTESEDTPVGATPVRQPAAMQQPAQRAGAESPPTEIKNSITYKPTLVAELKDDHRTLLKTFQDIRRAATDGKTDAVNQGLASLMDGLAAHLLKEDLYFYSYMQARFARQSDADSAETVHEFRKEMRQIAQAVKNFLSIYKGKVGPDNLKAFEADLSMVGEALGKRVGREETILYPLYQG